MVEVMDVSNDKVEKASKWTIYILVDLRVVFIITYVYVSVVNLISTTANSEATSDTNSMAPFTVTSKPEHFNVSISFIDNAVLWNCREYSVTNQYYRGLYWMLIAAFVSTLITFIVTKLAILCGSKHGNLSLWNIAVMKTVQEEVEGQSSSTKYSEEKAKAKADCYKELLSKEYYKNHKEHMIENHTKQFYIFKTGRFITLFISNTFLPIGMLLSFLSYDLHPLSCISTPSEESITYNATSEAVHIDFSEDILGYQRVVAVIMIVMGFLLFINVICFYLFTYGIIHIFKKKVTNQVSNLYRNKQST